jgi:hypothetical protein
MPSLVSIVELPSFARATEEVLSEDEFEDLKFYLAKNPEAGVVIPGTGGVRKLRWTAQGKGKRGGGRVIYYFHNFKLPLYLMAFFTKGAKSDLTPKEKKELTRIVEGIVASNSS